MYTLFLQVQNTYTPETLHNKVRYNPILDITLVRTGPHKAIFKDSFSYITY